MIGVVKGILKLGLLLNVIVISIYNILLLLNASKQRETGAKHLTKTIALLMTVTLIFLYVYVV